jgi:hypothetical protein
VLAATSWLRDGLNCVQAWLPERLFRSSRRFRSDVSAEPLVCCGVLGWPKTAREPDRQSSETQGENQGEGNRTAAREYDRAQEEFAKSGKVEQAARSAERALDTKEAKELKKAEELGRRHSHGEDPAVKR